MSTLDSIKIFIELSHGLTYFKSIMYEDSLALSDKLGDVIKFTCVFIDSWLNHQITMDVFNKNSVK